MRNRCLLLRFLLIFLTVCLCLPSVGSAQTDAEVNAGIQFEFSTPGARSLAMGGAQVALADDATAAFTNPAGLLDLNQPQVSIEGRRYAFTNSFTDRGHAFGIVTGTGVDVIEGLRTAEVTNETTGLSFASYFHPWAGGDDGLATAESDTTPIRRTRWALALYRHELLNFEAGFRTQGAFYDFFDRRKRLTRRLRPVIATFDALVVSYGISAAYRVSDRLGVGLGISLHDFEFDSLQQRFATINLDVSTGLPRPEDSPGSVFGPADFSISNEVDFQEQRGSDEQGGFNVGFLWQPSNRWRLGGAYRQGPEFEFQATNREGGFIEALTGVPRGGLTAEQTGRFNVPDVLALGLAFVPSTALRVTFDYSHIEYSALTEDLISVLTPSEFMTPAQRAALEALAVDDGEAYRLGFEYEFDPPKCGNCAVFLRLGAWHDPDHKMRFAAEPGLDFLTRSQAVQFQGGAAEHHFTGGLGVRIGEQLRIDAAADFSDTVDSASLSAVYYLPERRQR